MVKRLSDKPIVLKLGGSVITYKDKVSTPNLKATGTLPGWTRSRKLRRRDSPL